MDQLEKVRAKIVQIRLLEGARIKAVVEFPEFPAPAGLRHMEPVTFDLVDYEDWKPPTGVEKNVENYIMVIAKDIYPQVAKANQAIYPILKDLIPYKDDKGKMRKPKKRGIDLKW